MFRRALQAAYGRRARRADTSQVLWLLVFAIGVYATPVRAVVLWSSLGATLVQTNGAGNDILGGALHRDATSSDTLYFKFHVKPLSDVGTEEYLAAFELYEGKTERLALGNSLKAWAYSAFNTGMTGKVNKVAGDVDLQSAQPEALSSQVPYELPRRGVECTFIARVHYVPHGPAQVTVWLNPDLRPGASEQSQSERLTTRFPAEATFNEVHLRHEGPGGGWIFSDMAIATTFGDFVQEEKSVRRFWESWWFLSLTVVGLVGSATGTARLVERRRLHRRLKTLEKERTLERERARIAQDLHDDLGASLTRISLLSDLVKADKEVPGQVEAHANKISQSARQTVRALEEIVWALRPGSDSLQSLVEYLAHFANELFEGDGARCRLDLPNELPDWPLPPDMRHNIFLILKEALTNALKHADAKEVRVQAKTGSDWLELTVSDNGRGLGAQAPANPGKHNGLRNMNQRARAMGASLTVRSVPGQGTVVGLVVKFRGQHVHAVGKEPTNVPEVRM